jgi:hypothetical protein
MKCNGAEGNDTEWNASCTEENSTSESSVNRWVGEYSNTYESYFRWFQMYFDEVNFRNLYHGFRPPRPRIRISKEQRPSENNLQ